MTSWSDAPSLCETLVWAGNDNWRLPNIKELQSIVDFGLYAPAIDASVFPNNGSEFYWSSTTVPKTQTQAISVRFYGGALRFRDKIDPTIRLRCVRAGGAGNSISGRL